MNKLHEALDALTDDVVPAAEAALRPWLEMTDQDRDALSDWLQDRFRSRIQNSIEESR